MKSTFFCCSSLGLNVFEEYILEMFLKHFMFFTVLFAEGQKRRLHTKLILSEHLLSQPWSGEG